MKKIYLFWVSIVLSMFSSVLFAQSLYAQQLDFRQGAHERSEGLYMPEAERIWNTAENPSAKSIYPFSSNVEDQQFHTLLRELRCLVCQNQDLADSHAPLANDLRDEVYRQMQAGKTHDQIVHYLTDRYGDFILFKPLMNEKTIVLWLGPGILIGIGLCIFFRVMRRHG